MMKRGIISGEDTWNDWILFLGDGCSFGDLLTQNNT